MVPSRGFLRRIVFLLLLLLPLTSAANSGNNSSSDNACSLTAKCHRCTETDREKEGTCAVTGKIQEFTCIAFDDNDNEISSIRYESCRRTQADEEFLLVRLQVFCLTLGTLAFASVRKQRYASSNLFDKRKTGTPSTATTATQPKRGLLHKSNRSDFSTIELMATSVETMPLTQSDSMEIV